MTIRAGSSAPDVELERRAARADRLADGTRDDAPLRFAAGLLRCQARVVRGLQAGHRVRALVGRLDEDLERVLGILFELPHFAARYGPEALRIEAYARAVEDEDTARTRLLVAWGGDRGTAEDYLSRAMLRPYLECLRADGLTPDRVRAPGRCPFCGGGAALALLRGGSEGQGAARFFACAQCGLEWGSARILCVSCGEREPTRLPCFTSEAHHDVRLDACETCRRYVKTFDLTRDARPIPEVDDLASLALDLWAGERGFTRVEPGLAGI